MSMRNNNQVGYSLSEFGYDSTCMLLCNGGNIIETLTRQQFIEELLSNGFPQMCSYRDYWGDIEGSSDYNPDYITCAEELDASYVVGGDGQTHSLPVVLWEIPSVQAYLKVNRGKHDNQNA